MKKYKQKEIKELARLGLATDITDWEHEKVYALLEEIDKETIGTSHGANGRNGIHFRDRRTGTHYVVCARNSTEQIVGW